jgi:phosphoribosylformimino-5-aminoimidazole carboxamide ribotide isomerase
MSSAEAYLAQHGVESAIAAAVAAVLKERPEDPIRALAAHLSATSRRCRFRPCIDLHQGRVKQIVGSTLSDDPSKGPVTNFEASRPSEDFATMYRDDSLGGGHVIMLGPGNEEAAKAALCAYPGGLQVGGGITPANAASYLEAGASHVIVTSYVFRDGELDAARLRELVDAVGKERLVLDLSCRRREAGGPFYVVTDRWQKFTNLALSEQTLRELAADCSEFLVHAVDVEGKQSGIEEDLVKILADWSPIPVTYAGGARSLGDLELVSRLGRGRVDLAIGSALDCFGGKLPYKDVVAWSAGKGQ